ncbi:MAG: hypothetical protein AseanaTS_12550 [Candidatus Pelagadaptatus aseana]
MHSKVSASTLKASVLSVTVSAITCMDNTAKPVRVSKNDFMIGFAPVVLVVLFLCGSSGTNIGVSVLMVEATIAIFIIVSK